MSRARRVLVAAVSARAESIVQQDRRPHGGRQALNDIRKADLREAADGGLRVGYAHATDQPQIDTISARTRGDSTTNDDGDECDEKRGELHARGAHASNLANRTVRARRQTSRASLPHTTSHEAAGEPWP
jgi:hypothetical protein